MSESHKHCVPCVFASPLNEEIEVEAVFYTAKDDGTFCPGYVKQGIFLMPDDEIPENFWDVVKASYYDQTNLEPCYVNI